MSSHPPKIVFVRQAFTAHGGGELILARIMAALRARGVEVALLCRRWRDVPPGVDVITCDPPERRRSRRELAFARAACAAIAAMPDAIVQAHEKLPCADIYRAGEGTHAAFLDEMGRVRSLPARLAVRFSAFHRNRLRLERDLFQSRRLRAVIVNSRMVARDIAERFEYPSERIHLVPNGIDLDHFHPRRRDESRAAVRTELGVGAGRPVLLFAGSGYERKGLGAALRALADVPDAELWVAGGDRRPAAWPRLAARFGVTERVRFLGPRDGLMPLYAAADALILPAIYDPFPSTVIEAMAVGLPVVTSRSCGASEAVGVLDPRLVCDALEVDAVAVAARLALHLAADPSSRNRAREIAEGYGMTAMTDRLLGIYDRLIAERL